MEDVMKKCSMSSFKCKVILIGLLLSLAIAVPVLAQTIKDADDGTILKQIIIFGRHGIRSSTVAPSTLATFSPDMYPSFTGVPKGYLTPNGREAARLFGSYFHDYLLHEGLLTGNAKTDLSRLYFRANSIQRSNMTAAKIGEGLIPGATIPVHSYSIGDPNTGTPAVTDPVFDPIMAKIKMVTMDPDRAATEVQGIYGTGAALASAYSGELSLIRSVLYPPGTQPTPGAPQGSVDPTSEPITLTAYTPVVAVGGAINVGGLNQTTYANDPFVMQYADGFAPEDVAWGRLSLDTLSQQTRLTVLQMNIAMRVPYINQVQSSNAASHVLRSMRQAVSGRHLPGAFGDGKSRVLVIISSDYYVAGLAGLLGVHWTLPGYQPDFCSPGGALVFELRQSKTTKEYLVRVFYTSQTFDQLRNLTSLTLDVPPATMQLAIPGGSNSATDLDVPFATFKKLLSGAIGQEYVQPFSEEVPPGVIQNVPLD
jgi:4-phytase/acid phosphatase